MITKKSKAKKTSKRGRPTTKNNAENITKTLRQAMREGKMVRFSYTSAKGQKISQVTANIYNIVGNVAQFGVIRTDKSSAHPGYRPIKIANLNSMRILQRAPKKSIR